VALVVTVTLNPSLDMTASVDCIVPDDKLHTTLVDAEPGGGGINVSRVLVRFGVETQAVMPVGGMVGQEIASLLANAGVPVRAVPSAVDARRSITIFENDTGEHYRFVPEGHSMDDDQWRAVLFEVANIDPAPDVVVLSGSLPPGVPASFVGDLADLVRQREARLVVDSKGEALGVAVDVGAALVKPNLRELAQLVGHDGPREDLDVVTELCGLRDRGVGMPVASLGADGAIAAHDGGVTRATAPPVEVISAVGAGDSMLAGLIVGMIEGLPVPEALRLGVATGTAACLTPGSQLAEADEARRLVDEVHVEDL
jgi:6-phosphofructokinase 2